MKIGILGGTFNPPHKGHISLARAAMEECSLSQVIFMPSGISYFKNGTGVLSARIRSEMTELAIRAEAGFVIDDREAIRNTNSYTSDTLKQLRNEKKSDEFYYIIGADTLFSIEKWKSPEVIFKEAVLTVEIREGYDLQPLKEQIDRLKRLYGASIFLLKHPAVDISSTRIRELSRQGKDISAYVPAAVADYIEQHRLYE